MGPALTESSLTSRISHRDTKGQGGGAMAPMILSDDLYGELEDLVLHTPWRRSGVGLKRCSGSPKDSPPSRSPTRFRSAVRPSTTGRNDSASAKGSTSGHASSTPHARAALP